MNELSSHDIQSVRRPVLGRFIFGLVCLFAAIIAAPYAGRNFISENAEIRKRINATKHVSLVQPLESVALQSYFQLEHPYIELQNRARRVVNGYPSQSTTWDAIRIDKSVGSIRGLGSGEGIDSFLTALAVLRMMTYSREELRLLGAATRYEGPAKFMDWELGRWLELGYIDVARAHFSREEYFLGMASVQEGLLRARVRPIPNLRGVDGLVGLVSPLIIIDAFLPTDPAVTDEGEDLWQKAQHILDDEFATLAASANDPQATTPLAIYSSGVVYLREADYDQAIAAFLKTAKSATSLAARDLARFMSIRASFWGANAVIDNEVAPFRMLGSGEHGNTKVEALNDEERPHSQEEKQFQMIARAFISEMLKAGVLRSDKVKPTQDEHRRSATILTSIPSKVRKVVSKRCRDVHADMVSVMRDIESAHWREQSAEYLTALEGRCDDFA